MAELYDYQFVVYNLASNLVRNIFEAINLFRCNINKSNYEITKKFVYVKIYTGFYADALRFWIGTRDKYHGM